MARDIVPNGSRRRRRTKPRSPNHWFRQQAVQHRFLVLISIGASIREACAEVGVGTTTVDSELARNRDFRERLTRARARGITAALANHAKFRERDPRVCEWWLAVRDPDRFGKRRPGDITPGAFKAAVNQFIGVIRQNVDDKTFLRIFKQINDIAEATEKAAKSKEDIE